MNVNGFYLHEKQPDAILGGCIEIYENAWSEPHKTIEALEKEDEKAGGNIYWTKATTYGSADQQDRTNLVMSLTHLCETTNNEALQKVHNKFYTLLTNTINFYGKRYFISENFFPDKFQILKYRGGEEYKLHYDGTSAIARIISCICYLNDDYEGGELEFPHFNIKIKPKPGMLILFPSNFAYAHIAHPVKQGIKYAIVTWIKDIQV